MVSDMGLLDRMKKRPSHDETTIRELLEAEGATASEAKELVAIPSNRLSPDEIHVWLTHPEKSHSVPDPDASEFLEAAGLIPVVMNWTPINAVSAGKINLVIEEAKRYVTG
jgi:hypothetical protein